jgi:hypothetical protein
MAAYELAMTAEIASLRKKLETVERSVKAEFEAHSADPSSNSGYTYYTSEIAKIPERRESAIVALERKRETYNSSKETAIAKLEDDIEAYRRKKEAEINMLKKLIENSDEDIERAKDAVAAKYESQVKEYTGFIDGIVEKLAEPKSKTYLKNKEQVQILTEQIAQKIASRDARMEEEHKRKVRNLKDQQAAILAAERRAEEDKKAADLEAFYRKKAADEAADEKRRQERAMNPEPVVEIKVQKPKRILKQFSKLQKSIADITPEEAETVDPFSIPDNLLDTWVEKFGE